MKKAVEIGRQGWADMFLRIKNEPQYILKDLEACVLPGVKGIIIPKVETVERMREIEKIIDRLEHERNIEHGTIITNMPVSYTHLRRQKLSKGPFLIWILLSTTPPPMPMIPRKPLKPAV